MKKIVQSLLILVTVNSAFAEDIPLKIVKFAEAAQKKLVKCNINALNEEIASEIAAGRLSFVDVFESNQDSVFSSPKACPAVTRDNFSRDVDAVFCRNSNTVFFNQLIGRRNLSLFSSVNTKAHEYEHFRNSNRFRSELGIHPLDMQKELIRKAEELSKSGKWPKDLFRQMAQAQFLYLWDEGRGLLQQYSCSNTRWVASIDVFVTGDLNSGYVPRIVGKIKVPSYISQFVTALAITYQSPSEVINDSNFQALVDETVTLNLEHIE